jgi:hypothetical protein
MILDTNKLHLSDNEIRDLMIYYARENKMAAFNKFYKELYKDAIDREVVRCYYFIRLASGLTDDYINY